MKVRASLRSLKDKPGAKVVRRHGKTFVLNNSLSLDEPGAAALLNPSVASMYLRKRSWR